MLATMYALKMNEFPVITLLYFFPDFFSMKSAVEIFSDFIFNEISTDPNAVKKFLH